MKKNKETKRFDLMEFGSALGREEMKKLMAGSDGDCDAEPTMTCPEFVDATGCYPSEDPQSTCIGKDDGCSYNAASSSGSCG